MKVQDFLKNFDKILLRQKSTKLCINLWGINSKIYAFSCDDLIPHSNGLLGRQKDYRIIQNLQQKFTKNTPTHQKKLDKKHTSYGFSKRRRDPILRMRTEVGGICINLLSSKKVVMKKIYKKIEDFF